MCTPYVHSFVSTNTPPGKSLHSGAINKDLGPVNPLITTNTRLIQRTPSINLDIHVLIANEHRIKDESFKQINGMFELHPRPNHNYYYCAICSHPHLNRDLSLLCAIIFFFFSFLLIIKVGTTNFSRLHYQAQIKFSFVRPRIFFHYGLISSGPINKLGAETSATNFLIMHQKGRS